MGKRKKKKASKGKLIVASPSANFANASLINRMKGHISRMKSAGVSGWYKFPPAYLRQIVNDFESSGHNFPALKMMKTFLAPQSDDLGTREAMIVDSVDPKTGFSVQTQRPALFQVSHARAVIRASPFAYNPPQRTSLAKVLSWRPPWMLYGDQPNQFVKTRRLPIAGPSVIAKAPVGRPSFNYPANLLALARSPVQLQGPALPYNPPRKKWSADSIDRQIASGDFGDIPLSSIRNLFETTPTKKWQGGSTKDILDRPPLTELPIEEASPHDAAPFVEEVEDEVPSGVQKLETPSGKAVLAELDEFLQKNPDVKKLTEEALGKRIRKPATRYSPSADETKKKKEKRQRKRDKKAEEDLLYS